MENPPNPGSPQIAPLSFWDKYKRDVLLVILGVFASLVCIALLYHFFLTRPDIREDPNANIVDMVYYDAVWFHKLYVRWTITDWSLTFLAAGTAVSAAIKNTYSSKTNAVTALSWIDLFLIVLAVMTVLATTFDGKLHAAQLAEKYRYGDLHLQTAKFIYAASNKDAEAKAKLLASWREAQDFLESSLLTPPKTPGNTAASPNSSESKSAPQISSPGASANPPKQPH
jgi:hypothetical protein